MQVRPSPTSIRSSLFLPVTTIRFANDDKSLLACASRDGTLSVFDLSSEPPSLLATLRGHRRAVNGEHPALLLYPHPLLISTTDFDWSVANDLLVSVSSDGTARLWEPHSGACVREISDGSSGRSLCCRFHPNNNNLVAVSSAQPPAS